MARRRKTSISDRMRALFMVEPGDKGGNVKVPLCGARTRSGRPCQRKGLGAGGRCPSHGGGSTGPRTAEGRARISSFHKERWRKLRQEAKDKKASE